MAALLVCLVGGNNLRLCGVVGFHIGGQCNLHAENIHSSLLDNGFISVFTPENKCINAQHNFLTRKCALMSCHAIPCHVEAQSHSL
jgi:hypothetical protein